MTNLKGKRILYLGLPFFGYENDIQNSLISKGAEVDFFNERFFVSTLGKILVRLGIRFLINKAIMKHYEYILGCAEKLPYDYLFVVSPETMNKDFLVALKGVNPHVKTVLYMWDSISNKKNSNLLLPFFDRVLTFDPSDKLLYPQVELLPLFYVPEFLGKEEPSLCFDYSVAFVGTVHSDRYKIVSTISKQLMKTNRPPFLFFYCPSKFLYFLKRIFTSEFDGVKFSSVSFKPLSKSAVFEVLSSSRVVIDIEHSAQRGLTMRTIEVLASSRKLVTTNSEVVNYDFYDQCNICIVDRDNPVVPEDFMLAEYKAVDSRIVNKYALSNWIDKIFTLTDFSN
jgi:hypothetical protein